MKDSDEPRLTLVGKGEEFKSLFETLPPKDRRAFIEALERQIIQRNLDAEGKELEERGYDDLIQEYGRADVEHILAEKPWLYRDVEITALARKATVNDKERPEVLRKIREILTTVHKGTLGYTEDFLYEGNNEFPEGNIKTRVIGYRGPYGLSGLAKGIGRIFEQDLYPEVLPRTKVTLFQFGDFLSRESPSGKRLVSMVFQLGSYGTRDLYWHRINRATAYFSNDDPKNRIEAASLESALSKMLEIDHIASPLIIQAIAILPRSIERHFEEKSGQYREYLETLKKD